MNNHNHNNNYLGNQQNNSFNFNNKNTLIELSNQYKILYATRTPKINDLNNLILKLNELNALQINEADQNLVIEVINYLCDFLPKNDQRLLYSFTNSITYLAEKSIVKFNNQTLNILIGYFIDLFRFASSSITKEQNTNVLSIHDLFRCLGSLIYKNAANLNKNNLDKLISDKHGLLTASLDFHQNNDKNYLIIVQCIFNLTLNTNENDSIDDTSKVKCFKILIKILHSTKAINFNEIVYSRILIKSLQGIENLLLAIKLLPTDLVADILAVLKTLSFYGLNNLQTKSIASKQIESKTEIKVVPLKQSNNLVINDARPSQQSDSETEQNKSKQNEVIKRKRFTKKSTASSNNQQQQQQQNADSQLNKDHFNQIPFFDKYSNNQPINTTSGNAATTTASSNIPATNLISSTSESEYSDNEAAFSNASSTASSYFTNSRSHAFSIEKNNAKIRVAAINALQTAFQVVEKRTILSYWDSFIPNDLNYTTPNAFAMPQTNLSLITILLHDYSPKVRAYATQTLTLFIDCIKNLFQIANEQNTIQQTHSSIQQQSFISQSYRMTIIIKNLLNTFKYLIQQEEKKENYLNLIEILKCLNQLIKSIPFDKLKPGLLIKLIEFLLKYLFYSKKNFYNFQIKNTSLTCITTLINLKNVEIDLILKNKININPTIPSNSEQQAAVAAAASGDSADSLSLSGTLTPQLEQLNLNSYLKQLNQNQPNKVTYFYTNSSSSSAILSGTHTPTLLANYSTIDINKHNCWLIDYTIKHALNNDQIYPYDLRITCLNTLIILCKNYFHLFFIEQLNQLESLFLKNLSQTPSQQQQQQQQQEILLTLKLLEELTRYLSTEKVRLSNLLDLSDCVKLWLRLIDDTFLIKRYLTDEKAYLICSQVCDCLAACGSDIYEQLPAQQIRLNLIINLLTLTKSQSNLIRAASIRSLGVYITYPSLKEDFKFIYDLIDCIMSILTNDTNNLVKQKCTWSLSNLSEILIENKDKLGNVFVENFNSLIFFKLLRLTTDICSRESDKIKSYLVRTLGNLLNYITNEFLNFNETSETLAGIPHTSRNRFILTKQLIDDQVTKSIDCLIQCRNAKMLKVKWNLCHSFGIVLRNSHVLSKSNWQISIFDTLMDCFLNNLNYKIKINSIIALMQLQKRDYGLNIYYFKLWAYLFKAFFNVCFDNRLNDDTSNEFEHKNTLIQQMCKFLTYLCKFIKVDDLNEIEKNLKDIITETNLRQNDAKINLIDIKLSKQIKIYLNNYIYDILKDNETYKQEVQLYNEALNQLNLIAVNFKSINENELINLLRYLLKKTDFNTNASLASNASNAANTTLTNEQLTDDSDVDSQYLPMSTKYPFKQTYD